MKNTDKKNIVLIILVVLLFVTASYSSAFASRKKSISNHIVFGDLELVLIENTKDDSGKEVPFNNQDEVITEASVVSRIVRVENVCDNDMFVRIALNVDVEDENNNHKSGNEMVQYDINEKDWLYQDGYYYYKHILKARETTENLFEELTFDLEDDLVDSKLHLNIDVEAVQSKNNASNVLEAEGWPA